LMVPLWSTITLCTEIVITAIVLYVFYSGYEKNKFPHILAGIALAYEIIFNISYMTYRAVSHVAAETVEVDTPLQTGLAIFHGSLSLIMFLGLVVFFVLAWQQYGKGVNYFRQYRTLTIIFIGLWLIAVISGIVFYFVIY